MKNDKDPPQTLWSERDIHRLALSPLLEGIKKSPSVFFKTLGPLAVPTLTKVTVHLPS